jgi:SAM-dependent methyltransferase
MTAYRSFAAKVLSTPSKLAGRIHERGVADAIGWCFYQLQWRCREMRLGVSTAEFTHQVIVEDNGNQHGYEPIDYLCFDKVLEYLQPVSRRDGFLDYGCGMGRAVLLASMAQYGRVVGVELDERLVELANQKVNIVRQRGLVKADRVEIIRADATVFEVPADVNHIFLFNSFVGDVLQATLEQIRRSLERHPRELKLVYTQPIDDDDPLSKISWLELDRELSTGYWMHVRSRAYRNLLHKAG